jgi:hypothetical protein
MSWGSTVIFGSADAAAVESPLSAEDLRALAFQREEEQQFRAGQGELSGAGAAETQLTSAGLGEQPRPAEQFLTGSPQSKMPTTCRRVANHRQNF